MNINYSGTNGITVCKNCKERTLGCHSKCEKYLRNKELYEERKEEYKRKKRETYVINKGDFLGDSAFNKKSKRKRR